MKYLSLRDTLGFMLRPSVLGFVRKADFACRHDFPKDGFAVVCTHPPRIVGSLVCLN